MEKITFSSIEKIEVDQVKGDLYIRTWDDAEIQIIYNEAKKFETDDDGGILTLEADDSILISAPHTVVLMLEEIRGNCNVFGKFDQINIEKIGGNLEISQGRDVQVEVIGGNCVLGAIDGRMSVEKVGGNLRAQSLLGNFSFEKVGGNLHLNGTLSNFSCSVGGNANVNCDSLTGNENEIHAGGNLKMNLQPEMNFVLSARAGAQLRIKLGHMEEKGLSRSVEKTFGSGGSLLTLKAGGNLKLTDQEPIVDQPFQPKPFDDEAWAELEQRVETHLRSGSDVDLSYFLNLEKEINREITEKTKFAQERIQAAMEKMNKKFQAFTPEAGFTHTINLKKDKPAGVSDEERMMILQMLQDKKITAEEADQLLQILEDV